MALPIGFFMPLPLAMMIPFMGIQSAVMAKQFGENFQYGKRRISAMDNDEFNKLTPKILMSNANRELTDMMPEMKESIIQMQEFQIFLVKEFLNMIQNFVSSMPQYLLDLLGIDIDLGLVTTQPPAATPPPHEQSDEPGHTTGPIGSADYKYHQEQFRIKQEKITSEKEQKLKLQEQTNKDIDEIIINQPQKKRRAGQSQKLERQRLITKINAYAQNIKKISPGNPQYKIQLAVMQQAQKDLALLLTRYDFS